MNTILTCVPSWGKQISSSSRLKWVGIIDGSNYTGIVNDEYVLISTARELTQSE